MKRVLCASTCRTSPRIWCSSTAIVHRYGGCLTMLHVAPTSDAREMRPGEWVDPIVEHLRTAVGVAGITGDRVRYEVQAGERATAIVAGALALRAWSIAEARRTDA